MQRALLADGRTRVVIALGAVDVEGLGQFNRFAVFNEHRAELKRLPCVGLLELVGDEALLAGAVGLSREIAVFIDDKQMMLLDVLRAQELAIADDHALAMIAAEVGVDGEHRAVASGDVADGFIDAAAEVVARKRRLELADIRKLYVGNKVGHAVLLLLLDGYLELIGFIDQLARLIELEAGCRLRRDFRARRGAENLLLGFLLRVDHLNRLIQLAARLWRFARQHLQSFLVLLLCPIVKS